MIFHSKPEDPVVPDNHLWANPWGLADWFNSQTRVEADFAKFFEERADDFYARRIQARAPAEDVPDRKPAHAKSRALIALQLIKRWRNVLFDRRDRAKLRRPPSVLLTKLVGDNANRTKTLAEELEHQAAYMLTRFEYEVSQNRKIVEVNPQCPQDVLTDRWPESMFDQKLLIDDLKDFIAKIRRLRSGTLDLAQMTVILEGLFGQRPVRKAVDDYIASMAPSRTGRVVTSNGRVLAPAAGVATPSSVSAIPPHKFFGDHNWASGRSPRVRADPRRFPSFREVFDAEFAGCWEGELAPNARSYRICILYFPFYRYASGAWQPSKISVRIISPIIGFDPRGTGERPPHIYADRDGLGFSLCLYDPWEDDWRAANSIAETIIPWTAEWLFWFEVWLLTGIWSGGDAPHGEREFPMSYEQPVLPRSAGSIPGRRVPQDWPRDRDFRILSIDGGGIRGIFPAAVLADFEATLGPGASIADHFDLAAGTSTGGIIALGLGAGKTGGRNTRSLFAQGPAHLPAGLGQCLGSAWKLFRNNVLNIGFNRYNRFALERALEEFLARNSSAN